MKKLLTILGAIGLTATGSMSVVSCSHKTISQTFKGLDSIDSNWGNIQKFANFYNSDLTDLNQNKVKAIIGSGFKNYQDVYNSTLVGKLVYFDSVSLNKNPYSDLTSVNNLEFDSNGNSTNAYLELTLGTNTTYKKINFIDETNSTVDSLTNIDVQDFVRNATANKNVIKWWKSTFSASYNSIVQTYNSNKTSDDDSDLKEQIVNTSSFYDFVRNDLGTIINFYSINNAIESNYDNLISNSLKLQIASYDFVQSALNDNDNKLNILNSILNFETTNKFEVTINNITISIDTNIQGENNG